MTMKLLLTTDAVGGVWTYTIDLVRALAAHDVQAHIATMGPPPREDQRAQVRELRNATLHESTFALEWADDPWDDVARAGEWLLDLERQLEPDVIHLNGYAHGSLPWRAPVVVVAHSCVLSWWQAVKGEPAPPRYERYRQAVSRGLHNANLVVAPSHTMLDALRHHYGPLPQTLVIDNARSPRGFAASATKEPFILTAGRMWDEAKNVAALRAVAPKLAWPMYVAGEEARENSSENVNALGRLSADAMASWLGRASIYALPARYEPFGLSVLEAALSGCALVLGDIPSLRENWTGAAAFVAPDDHEALQSALSTLIDQPGRIDAFAAAARRRAAAFSPARFAEEYLAAYSCLLPSTKFEPAAVLSDSSDAPSRTTD